MKNIERSALFWVMLLSFLAIVCVVLAAASNPMYNGNKDVLKILAVSVLVPGISSALLQRARRKRNTKDVSEEEGEEVNCWIHGVRVKALLDNLSMPCYVTTKKNPTILYGNQRLADFLGISSNAFRALSFKNFAAKFTPLLPSELKTYYLDEQRLRTEFGEKDGQLPTVRYLIDNSGGRADLAGFWSLSIHRTECDWMEWEDTETVLAIYSLRRIDTLEMFKQEIEIDKADMPRRVAYLRRLLGKQATGKDNQIK